MSQWLQSLSREEWREIFDDACASYNTGIIDDQEFRMILAKLGFNASDIQDKVKEHQPL